MNTLSIDIKNCYGIKRLTETIDFSEGNTHIIYAPNGSMKSSFAKVFKDIKEDRIPKDRIFTHRPSSFDIKYNNVPLDSQQILIVDPYVENFNNERINTLLATDDLKEKYNEIDSDIKSKRNEFMSSMSARLKIKGDPAKEMYATFPESEGDLVKCIFLLKKYLEEYNEIDFSWIDYAVLFNDKSIAFLQSVETKNLLEEYSAVFNGLIENSHYFRKGGFNHNSAGNISKGLSSSGFFDAKHS